MSRTFTPALGAMLSVVLAACGDGGDGKPTAAVSGDATTTKPPEPAPEGRGTVSENADGTRTVTSAYGTATVPARAERIVSVLGYIDFESMLALGVTPVGAGTQGGTVGSGFAPHLQGRTGRHLR